ncbi:MAG: hypothetical protein ACR2QF_11870 [Geminicoccaceae bacterium]
MISSKYNQGTTTELHYNGRDCRLLLHVNDHATLEDVMADGYFDLPNRNRGAHPWISPGYLIDVNAFDGYARLRVMSMGADNADLKTMAVTTPVLFDQKPKRRPGRPKESDRQQATVN